MNLTKKQIKATKTTVLNFRYGRLLQKGKRRPKEISMAEAREILGIEDELRSRLIKELGRDPYPPDRIEKKAPSNYMISLLKSRKSPPGSAGMTKKAEADMQTGGKFGFKITIKSSIGSVVAQKNVKVDSRNDADVMAVKLIDLLGLKKASYKIS